VQGFIVIGYSDSPHTEGSSRHAFNNGATESGPTDLFLQFWQRTPACDCEPHPAHSARQMYNSSVDLGRDVRFPAIALLVTTRMTKKSTPRKINFKIEGNSAALLQLAELIAKTIESTAEQPSARIVKAARIGGRIVEVHLKPEARTVRNAIESREDAVQLLDGWAENKSCVRCAKPVALLFEEEYIQSSLEDAPVCARCAGDSLDAGETI
jgi:hypothetical protein